MVKSGIFGQTAKFGQRPRSFHISNIGIKKINKANSENPHKEPSHLDLHCLQMGVRIYLMSEFTRLYPTLLPLFHGTDVKHYMTSYVHFLFSLSLFYRLMLCDKPHRLEADQHIVHKTALLCGR